MPDVTTAGELQSVKEAVDIGTTLRYCWFRGHRRVVGELLPTAHRKPFWGARPNIEFWAGQRFRLRAPAHININEVPKWDDYPSWLFLAQHHGVPTRLLDWTENVLVGLYFAVTGEDQKEDGELWCMNYQELNWRSANSYICFPDSESVRYLAAAAFVAPDKLTDEQNNLFAALGIAIQERNKPTINGPIALIPPMQFPRMAAQKSTFTIHPSREPEVQIEFLLRGPTSLARYIIPSAYKASLARDLRGLGFTEENLFRSLDSLARTIKEEIVEPDYYIAVPQFDRAGETKDVPLPETGLQ
jgi:hypothetical protein